jgi:hypothetical protein
VHFEQELIDSIPEMNRRYREAIARNYQKLLDMLSHPPPLDFPEPPKEEFDVCIICDNYDSYIRNFQKEVSQWSGKFFDYELNMMIETLFLIEGDLNSLRNNKAYYISKNGDENLKKELMSALELAFERMDKKMQILDDRYHYDVHRHSSFIRQVLAYELLRLNYKIEGNSSITPSNVLIKELSNIFEDYIKKAMERKDYNVVLNYRVLLKHERERQIATGGVKVPGSGELIYQVIKFNRFAALTDIDFEYQFMDDDGEIVMKATGTVQSPSPLVQVRLGRRGCKWQLYLADVNYEKPSSGDDLSIPLLIVGGSKMVKENKAMKTYPYSGPGKMRMIFPSTRIDFCTNGNKDSALLYPLHYETGANLASLAKSVDKNYSVDFLAYANKMMISPQKAESNKDKTLKMATTIPEAFFNVGKNIGNPMEHPIIKKLQSLYLGVMRKHELQKQWTEMAAFDATILLFDAVNQSEVLIDNKTEISYQPNKKESVKGTIYLKVVHNPGAE